jgi:hypothetical protein
VTKALLPVGSRQSALYLRQVVIGTDEPPTSGPPRRAKAKTLLSYHFLSAGHDRTLAVAVTGRLQKVTCWVPLVKAQSIRRVQGPLQRALQLATVHVDVAGRRVSAKFKDRSVEEADRLVEELASLSRGARRLVPGAALVAAGGATARPTTAPVTTPGWFADPARRHQARYWNGSDWTEHVADGGVTAIDPL